MRITECTLHTDLTDVSQSRSCKRVKLFPCFLLPIVLAACSGPPDNTFKAPPPPEVTVAKPVVQTVTLYIEETGETEAVERADIRARVEGFLEEIKFQPGDSVKKDDLLYQIDQREYLAARNSAQASVKSSEALVEVANSQVGVAEVEVTRADLDYKRYKDLFDKGASTQQELDESKAAHDAAIATKEAAIAAVDSAEADLAKAEANLAQAELDLGFTKVVAPISGVSTKTAIKKGNLVQNGSVLASVVDKSRIYANFNISDREALRLQKARREDGEVAKPGEVKYRSVPVYLKREIDTEYQFSGHLEYVDQEGIDQATGTLAIRAVFENSDDKLLPGLFVNVRVPIGQLEDSILLPESAVFRDQRGAYSLVVNAEKKVERKPVVTGQTFENMVLIEEGISADDQVVLEGSQRARPGTVVDLKVTELSPIKMESEQPGEDQDSTQDVESEGDSTDQTTPADSQ